MAGCTPWPASNVMVFIQSLATSSLYLLARQAGRLATLFALGREGFAMVGNVEEVVVVVVVVVFTFWREEGVASAAGVG